MWQFGTAELMIRTVEGFTGMRNLALLLFCYHHVLFPYPSLVSSFFFWGGGVILPSRYIRLSFFFCFCLILFWSFCHPGDRPRLGSANSMGDMAMGKPRVLTTYSAARYRRGSSSNISSAPNSPPMSPISPVFSPEPQPSAANTSVRTLNVGDAPVASSTPDQRYRVAQQQAVDAAARCGMESMRIQETKSVDKDEDKV